MGSGAKELKFEITVDDKGSATIKGFGQEVGKAGKAGSKSFKGMSARLDSFKKKLSSIPWKKMGMVAAASATIAVASFAMIGKSVLATGIGFETTMKTVQAYSGATGKELAALESSARLMGATTEHSAQQSADALKYLVSAGFDAQQSIAALPGTLDLATAGQVDLATATDITTDVLTAFGLEVSELSRVSDAFITTSSSSNTNVLMLGESMKYVAPAAAQLGYSIEETSGMLGTLANSGIKASMAGTNLQQILMKTAGAAEVLGLGPGAKLIDVLKEMKAKQWDMNKITAEFGLEAAKSAAVLMNNIDSFENLTQKITENKGATQDLATIMRDSLGNDVKTLQSSIQELALKAFAIVKDDMRILAQRAVGVAKEFGKWIEANKGLLKQNISKYVETAVKIFNSLKTTVNVLVPVVKFMAAAFVKVGEVIGTTVAKVVIFTEKMERLHKQVFANVTKAAKFMATAFVNVGKAIFTTMGKVNDFITKINPLKNFKIKIPFFGSGSTTRPLGEKIDEMRGKFEGLYSYIGPPRAAHFDITADAGTGALPATEAITALEDLWGTSADTIKKNVPDIQVNTEPAKGTVGGFLGYVKKALEDQVGEGGAWPTWSTAITTLTTGLYASIQKGLSDAFFVMATDIQDLQDVWDNFTDNVLRMFTNMLGQMATQMAASSIIQTLSGGSLTLVGGSAPAGVGNQALTLGSIGSKIAGLWGGGTAASAGMPTAMNAAGGSGLSAAASAGGSAIPSAGVGLVPGLGYMGAAWFAMSELNKHLRKGLRPMTPEERIAEVARVVRQADWDALYGESGTFRPSTVGGAGGVAVINAGAGISFNIKVVTPDGEDLKRQTVKMTFDEMLRRSKNREIVIHANGVGA